MEYTDSYNKKYNFTTEYVYVSLNEIISEFLYNKGYATKYNETGIEN